MARTKQIQKVKRAKPAPKSKKVDVVKSEDEEEVVLSEEEVNANNGNSEDAGSDVEEEPPAKKGKGGKGKAAKKTPAKRGRPQSSSSRARKTPAKKEESEEEEDEKEYEVQNILDDRMRKGQKEYLVKWKGYGRGQSTWEPESNLNCDEAIAEYEDKKKETKNSTPKELREGRKQTQRYADIAGSGQDHKKRHSRRNANSPRKTYRDVDSD